MANESDIRRAERKRQRELKDARKEELSEATSSFERRQIKAKYAEPRENLNEGRKESNLDDSMSQREAAAGLNLSGNNTTYGRGQQMPTMSEREAAAGLNLFGNDTTVGRDSFYDSEVKALSPGSPSSQIIYPDGGGGGLGGGGDGSSGGNAGAFTLDVVKDDNTAGTATFLGSGINEDEDA
tara:strand:+ start:34 stop:579 length:546 start_codon:yes stop_codon:yes gene_type:complete